MTDIHDRCRANMEKADRALRAALDEIERLTVALEEIKHTTSHEIRRWDIANETARRALEPKP